MKRAKLRTWRSRAFIYPHQQVICQMLKTRAPNTTQVMCAVGFGKGMISTIPNERNNNGA